MKFMMYQQSRAITAARSRNRRIGINKLDCKTDFVYLTSLPSNERLAVIEQALIFFENVDGFDAQSVTYLADSVSGQWTVRFTVAGEREDISLDFEVDTNQFAESEEFL